MEQSIRRIIVPAPFLAETRAVKIPCVLPEPVRWKVGPWVPQPFAVPRVAALSARSKDPSIPHTLKVGYTVQACPMERFVETIPCVLPMPV